MTAPNELRLLPWTGPEDKPCYLSTDDPNGYMSRLANDIESDQLDAAGALLQTALDTLEDGDTDPAELRRLGHGLADALRGMLRVAASRGHLLEASGLRRI